MISPQGIVKIYWKVYFALLALLAAIVVVGCLPLGNFSLAALLTLSVLEASLVIMFFMHARYSEQMVWVFAIGGFLWLLIGLFMSAPDFLVRYSSTLSSKFSWLISPFFY